MERAAIKDLQQAQSKGQIQIKPANKGGGMVIMDSCDYENQFLQQLKWVFTNEDSTTSPFYEKIQQKALDHQTKEVEKIIDKGFQMDFISKSDKDFMKPSGKPNRLYGLPKIQKGVHEGRKIPSCRPIVSNSGSNTENISALIDHYSKHLVKELDSYVEDTPHLLQIIDSENQKGPQNKNTFSVTIEVCYNRSYLYIQIFQLVVKMEANKHLKKP